MKHEQTVRFANNIMPNQQVGVKSDLNEDEQVQLIYGVNMTRNKLKTEFLDKARDRRQYSWRIHKSDVRDICFTCHQQYLFGVRTKFKEIDLPE